MSRYRYEPTEGNIPEVRYMIVGETVLGTVLHSPGVSQFLPSADAPYIPPVKSFVGTFDSKTGADAARLKDLEARVEGRKAHTGSRDVFDRDLYDGRNRRMKVV